MSTKKNSFAVALVFIGWFPIVILLPLRCMAEVIEGYADILCLFRFASKKVWGAVTFLENIAALVRNYGPLDLANVDINTPDAKVHIRLLLR